MLTTFSGRCVLRGAENRIFFLVYKVIHKSNSFQTCSQSFNKIICWQKFYLPFKGSSQSATTLHDPIITWNYLGRTNMVDVSNKYNWLSFLQQKCTNHKKNYAPKGHFLSQLEDMYELKIQNLGPMNKWVISLLLPASLLLIVYGIHRILGRQVPGKLGPGQLDPTVRSPICQKKLW